MSFTEIPVLDLSLARDDATKQQFLSDLRHALLNVGFLYLSNTGIDQELYNLVCDQAKAFFDLPDEEKLRIEMKNEPSFLGFSRVSLLIILYTFPSFSILTFMTKHTNIQTCAYFFLSSAMR